LNQTSRNKMRMPSEKKKKFSFQNLRFQLSLIAIGIPTLVLLLFGIYRIQVQTAILENELDISLKNEARQLSASLSTALFNFDDETCKVICKAALKKPEIIKITVWDLEQEYLVFNDKAFPDSAHTDRTKITEIPISFKSEVIGKVRVVATTDFLDTSIARLKTSSFMQVVVLDLVLGFVLILVLNLRFVKPLQDLQISSEEIARGKLDHPINVHRNDELGALADNLVIMRDAVKDKVESLVSEVIRHQKTSLALEKSESFLRLIIDLIPHMISVRDASGRFLVVNQAMADDLNSSVEKLTGQLPSDAVSDQERIQDLLQSDRQVIDNGATLNLLTQTHLPSAGESKWYSTKKIPFTAPDGDQGVVGITIDITELKQAEEELKKTKNYIDNIINSMPSALFSLDREMNIILWNRKAEKIFLISAADAIGSRLEKVLPQMAPYLDDIADTVKTGQPHYFSKQAQKRDKGVEYQDITVYPLMAESMEGAVIRVDDITEHVRMEEMVVQSEKMMSVGGLAAGMAHEINNPLAGMMQNAQVVLRRIQSNLPASVSAAREAGLSMDQIRAFMEKRGIVRQLELIHDAGVRASRIVRNMLSFSRKEFSGKVAQDITELLDQTIELARSDYDLKRQYDFKQIRIVREYDPDTPQVMCEVSKIQQVFFNILKNCAEAMQDVNSPSEPTFIIRVRPVGRYVRVEIEDNGPGMTEDTRKRIFEPFFTTKPVGKGTGLGLSVSYFIVTENHNGKMNVISQPGKGATFIIQLPLDNNSD
jgi:PAS domain S-box-containing protein